MAVSPGFLAACPHTAEVFLRSDGTLDSHGDPEYSATPSVVLRARVVQKQNLVRTVDGSEVPSDTVVYCAGDFAFDPTAKVRLPDFSPDVRPVIAVERFPIPSGAHHVQVYL